MYTANGEHKKIEKGWGWEVWICNTELYCGKLLHMDKGKCLSWHYHKLKDETFYVRSGKVLLLHGDDDDIDSADRTFLHPGDSFHIYCGLKHRLVAHEDSDIFEFSTQHFDEDSYRLIRGD